MDVPEPAVLREYSLLADGCRGILVGPQGDMAWGCFPRWDSDAVFCALLGGEGFYLVRPLERHSWGGYYEDGSLIWRSRWVTNDADVESRDALAFPGRDDHAVILRRLESTRGAADVTVTLQLRRSFGRQRPTHVRRDADGSWSLRLGELYVRWLGPDSVDYDRDSGAFTGVVHLEPDARVDLVLELATQPIDAPRPPNVLWQATEDAWGRAIPELADRIAARDCRHAAAVLRGLTSPSGAMVAAATMALPERAGGDRDYDYRYAWIRDQCMVGEAAGVAGAPDLLDAAVRFVTARVLDDGPQLRPAYTVAGDPVPAQRPIDVPGYPGSPDVVAGNRAGAQFQLDVFGEVLLLLATAADHDRLDPAGWQAAEIVTHAIASRWQEKDAGIWETQPRLHAHSRLICAAGLRRMSAAATPGPRTAEWAALADKLLAATSESSVHPSGRWMRAPDDDRCDAALLLPQVRGLLGADDPRSVATLRTVCDELTLDGYVFRYSVHDQPLGVEEGAFLLCGYWLSMALADAGEVAHARALFERNRAACGPAALFTEEYDVTQRQLRGNLPQAFVHALMLETACRLSDAGG
jgi:GH15 family glucan-1,4-alpha-glucosidase